MYMYMSKTAYKLKAIALYITLIILDELLIDEYREQRGKDIYRKRVGKERERVGERRGNREREAERG